MRVLLIGGTGFIGRSVVERLHQRGHDVVLFHRGQTEPSESLDIPQIVGNRLEIGAHLDEIGAADIDAAIDFLPWNGIDTRRVIDALNGRIGRVVHLSSGDVYQAWGNFINGTYGEPLPIMEESDLRKNLYPYKGTSPGMDDYDKVLAEREIFKAYFDEGYPGVIMRLPMVYGPHDRQMRIWPFIKRMLDKRPAILLSHCHGAWLWQRGYVDNVAYGLVLAAERSGAIGQVYNIGSPLTYTMASWIQAIGNVVGWEGDIVMTTNNNLPEHLQNDYTYQQHILYNTDKVRRELGYHELLDLGEALKRTVEWQIANPPAEYDESQFDYKAEDAALKAIR